ncbi:hypothetical protein B7Y92_01180 [Candidatus Saccharibacteria bacterium 32-50-13]|nr:MAG: hypothetical protein B7Y92_01180 [Candidatus Saccharibacteria bacterium 32-50-13]
MNNETQSARPLSDDEAYRQYVEANQTQEDLDRAAADGRLVEQQAEKTYETMSRAELANVIGRAEAVGDTSTSMEAQHFLEEQIEKAVAGMSDELPEYEDRNGNIVHDLETPRQRYRRMLTDKYLNKAIGIKESADLNEQDTAHTPEHTSDNPETELVELVAEDNAGLHAEITSLRAQMEADSARLAELEAKVEARTEAEELSDLTSQVEAQESTPVDEAEKPAEDENAFIDRSSETAQRLEEEGVLPKLNQRRESGKFASGKEDEYVTAHQLDVIEANADLIKAGRPEEDGDSAGDAEETVAESAEVVAEKKELAAKQPRATRKETNGPIEKLVVYTDGSFEWVPVEPKVPTEEATGEAQSGEAAPGSDATDESGDGQPEAAAGDSGSSAEDAPGKETDSDRAREIAQEFNLDDPVQMGKYRAKLEKEGISTAGFDAEALKRIAAGEENFPSDAVEAKGDQEENDTSRTMREIAEEFNLDDPVQMGKFRAKLEKEGISTASLDAEALKRIVAGEEEYPSDTTEAGSDTEGSNETGGDDDDAKTDDEAKAEQDAKNIADYDKDRLENLLKLRDQMQAESERLRAEGKTTEADAIDNKIVGYNLTIKELEERLANQEGSDSEPGKEKADNPTLDNLPAREDEASKEQAEKDKALGDAADRLAELKAQPWFRKDKEAIKAAEAEYLKLAQEAGREIVDGYEDEAARQTMFAATQVAMWEDINNRVAEIKKQTGYGKFTEAFGKMHPAARMAVMAGAGIGIGVAAAAAGTVTGGVGGAAVLGIATGWAAKLAKAKVNVDIAGTEANQTREKGKFDAFMAGASKVTGLAKLTKWGERRLDRKFDGQEVEAMKTIDLAAVNNNWTQDEIDAEKAKRKAELTDQKNKARSRRAMATSAVVLIGGGTASFIAAETLGMPSLEDHLGAKDDQTDLEKVTPRDEGTEGDGSGDGGEGDHEGDGGDTGEETGPLPGEYTADNINVNYEEFLSENKISEWAMGEKMDMTSTETAMDDMWDLGESDPGHAGQMVQGYLTEAQKEELGLGGMTPQQVENALHDDATRAAALNMIAEQLENGGATVEIVDDVHGSFYNWGARPVDANGNTISMEEARANGISDTELVQSERYLNGVSLLRVTDANGNVSYFNSECKNFLTEKPTPDIPVATSDPVSESPSDPGTENPGTAPDGEAENPGTAPEDEAENPGTSPDGEEENPGTAPDGEEENPGTAPDGEEENPGTAPEDEAENPGTSPDGEEENPGTAPDDEEENPGTAPDGEEENPSDEIEENPKTEDASEYPTAPDAENPGTAPEDEAENPGTSPDGEEENPGTAPDGEEENPGTAPDGEEENPGTAPDAEEENPSDPVEENPSDEAEENPSDYDEENPSDPEEENPSDPNEENPSDEAEENPSDEIEENPKSEDPDDYPTEEDVPPAEVDEDQGETEPPEDTEDNATAEETPHEEVPSDHDAGTAEEAEPVPEEEREEEVEQAPVDPSAPSEEAPGTEVTGPGAPQPAPAPAPAPAPEPQPQPAPAPEPAPQPAPAPEPAPDPAPAPAPAEVDPDQGETEPPEDS